MTARHACGQLDRAARARAARAWLTVGRWLLCATCLSCGTRSAPSRTDASASDGADTNPDVHPLDVRRLDAGPLDVGTGPADSGIVDALMDAPSDGPRDAPSDLTADASPLGLVAALVRLTPPEVRLLSLDGTGALTTKSTVLAPESALEFTRSADGRLLYVLGRKAAAFAVDPLTASLSPINEVETGLLNWSGLAVDPGRRWLLLSDGTVGIGVFGLKPDGAIVRPNDVPLTGQKVSDITLDPAGKFLFGLSCDDDVILRYAFDADTGTLRAATPPLTLPGEGPHRMVFAPSKKMAYVLNGKAQTVTSFDYEAATGTLTAPESVSLPTPGSQPLLGSCGWGHLVIHPSGKLAFATAAESGGSVTIMAISDTGRLTVIGHEPYVLFRFADALAVDPTGSFLLVGNGAGGLHVFRIDPADGHLTYTSFGVQGVSALEFLP